MCPGIAVLGGGGGGGDGDGDASGGRGGAGGGGKGKGKGGKGDGKGGAGCGAGSGADGGGCPNHHESSDGGGVAAGDPVDVVTGRVFIVPVVDLELPGPLPLSFERHYSSAAGHRDVGLGAGFSHSLAWEVLERPSGVTLHTHDGTAIEFGRIVAGEGTLGAHGWILHREGSGFALDFPDRRRLLFQVRSPVGGGVRHRLTEERDSYGNRTALSYRDGILAEIVDCVGRVVRVTSTREGRIESLSLKNAPQQGQWVRVVRYGYDDAGRLVSVEDADGVRTGFAYDDDGRLSAQRRPGGLTFFYRYDARGRCIETWGEYPGASDPSLAPDVSAFLSGNEIRAKGVHHARLVFGDKGYSEVTTSIGTQRYFGNEHGKLDKAVTAGAVYTRKYDERGFLIEFQDACGAKTCWERDLRGRETKIVDALGHTTLVEREPDGHIRRIVDPGGGVTLVERGPSRVSWSDPIGATFQIHVDARGLTERTVAPNGDVTRYRHDEHGNTIEVTDARGGVSRATYDDRGRPTTTTDAAGGTTRFVYSSGGRVVSTTHADGETVRYQYDDAGRVAVIEDRGGRTTQTYGGLDRLCEVVSPNGERVSLRYDREGRLATVTNARGEVHRFVRGLNGEVLQERTFDGRTLRFRYDAMGRVIAATNGARQTMEIERDLLGQMVKRTSDDGEEVFEYDARGDVVRATAGPVEVLFERNPVGWILRETQRIDGEAVVVDLAYDLMGELARRTTSRGHELTWERRGAQAAVVLDGGARVEVAYDLMGREIGRRLPEGGIVATAYDAAGRLSSRRVTDPTGTAPAGDGEPALVAGSDRGVTVDQRYAFSAGLLTRRWDKALGLTRFEYDPLGRLLTVVPEHARAELFRYAPGGELHDAHADTRAYGPGARPLRSPDREYTWDDAGQLAAARAADGTLTRYEWSGTGQLLAVVHADGRRVELAYDPFDRRLLKRTVRVEGGERRVESTTRFVWDARTLVHEIKTTSSERGDPVVEERTYCFEERRSAPWAQRDVHIAGGERVESGWYHYLNDDSGAPERLVDGKGGVACELALSTWGHGEVAAGSATLTPFRFRGQYADEETGLSYNFHRYYDPATGRYISADPIGIQGGLDVFAYANNCPTSAVDVEGLMYSIIRDANGNPVVDGSSAGGARGGTQKDDDPNWRQYPQGCAEKDALSKLGSPADAKAAFGKGYTIETYDMTKAEYEKASKADRLRARRNPCPNCARMLTEMGLAGQTYAPNENQGTTKGSLKDPWNGTATSNDPNKK
jgi:RHS repeat-associated protein